MSLLQFIQSTSVAARLKSCGDFKGNNTRAAAFLIFCTVFGFNTNAYAEEPELDTFKLALGGYTLARNETDMSLTARNVGIGASIDPEEALGVESEQTVFRIDGYYRYNPKHSLTYSWYRIKSTGHKSTEKDFEWVDDNGDTILIPLGARVDSLLEYDIYKLGYLWSFHHTDKVEIAAGAGLHLTRITIGLEAEYNGTDLNARDVSTSVPLPVLSFSMNYNVTRKFNWYLKTEAFALEFDEWSGIYTDSSLGVEYRVTDNLGLGFGYGTNALEVTQSTDTYDFTFSNRISGFSLYLAGYY
ncbi:hypothetical protein [Kaarinaea lacus]